MRVSNLYPACRLSWDTVAKIVSEKIREILGHPILCIARQEDMDYWGIAAVGYRFRTEEIKKLMEAAGTNEDACPNAIPIDEDSTSSLGMELSEFLLQEVLKATWECEAYTEDEIWLINYREQSGYDEKKRIF